MQYFDVSTAYKNDISFRVLKFVKMTFFEFPKLVKCESQKMPFFLWEWIISASAAFLIRCDSRFLCLVGAW